MYSKSKFSMLYMDLYNFTVLPNCISMPLTCLVISTYNRPDALELCIQSVLIQTVLPAEVIIADDGSKEDTLQLINHYQQRFPIPLHHVWHEDTGFQLAKIRNKAIASSVSDYIIQIDGDLILDPHFIEDHLSISEKNYFVRGSRISLNEKVTRDILEKHILPSATFIRSKNGFSLNALRIPILKSIFRYRYQTTGRKRFIVKGCNMAFWRNDFIKVNGYNEAFSGWGHEDVELCVRFLNAGINKQSLKFSGIVFHLFHIENSRNDEEKNYAMFEMAIHESVSFCKVGVDQYLQSQYHG